METIRLGTIGSGVIVRSVLTAAKMTPGILLEAVYSRSSERGQQLAQEFGADKVYTDLKALLSDEKINFVYIASPNSLHYEQVRAALLHNKNVICEKPFCPSAGQVRELMELARRRGLFLVDATPTAYLPNLTLVRQALPEIGRLRLVLCNYTQYSSRYDALLAGQMTNIFDPQFAGGCLQDINYYNVYFNVALFGRPDNLTYYANIYPGAADTSGILLMQYPGFISSCAGSKDARGESSALLEGEKGYIQIRDGTNGIAQVRIVTREGERLLNDQTEGDRYLYAMRNMTSLLLRGDHEAINDRMETTAMVMEVLEKARRTAGVLFPGDDEKEEVWQKACF